MPVDTQHAEYAAALPKWERARDVFAGEDAVKAAREKYLPRLENQSAANVRLPPIAVFRTRQIKR